MLNIFYAIDLRMICYIFVQKLFFPSKNVTNIMKYNILYYFAFTLFLIASSCKKDDEVVIPDYPIKLAFFEMGENSTPMLKTFDTNDVEASESLELTQSARNIIDNRRAYFPDTITLLSDELSYFDAADVGSLSIQSSLDSISYTHTNDDFEFIVPSSGRKISGNGTPIEIKIPYYTFSKKGISSSGGNHLPVSYENYYFTDFFDGDSIVYIQYDVIYKLAE